jgi:hypothetical protein
MSVTSLVASDPVAVAVTLDRVIAIDGDVCDRPPSKSSTGASAALLVAGSRL